MGVSNERQLKERILEKCNSLNMAEMAQEVQPFYLTQEM
jgi:hypothetical protein